jgi:hypothetical protein
MFDNIIAIESLIILPLINLDKEFRYHHIKKKLLKFTVDLSIFNDFV